MDAFIPAYGTGITAEADTTSARSAISKSPRCLLLTNLDAANTVYFRPGDADVVATSADLAVAPLQQIIVWVDGRASHVAYLAAADTADIHAIGGEMLAA